METVTHSITRFLGNRCDLYLRPLGAGVRLTVSFGHMDIANQYANNGGNLQYLQALVDVFIHVDYIVHQCIDNIAMYTLLLI